MVFDHQSRVSWRIREKDLSPDKMLLYVGLEYFAFSPYFVGLIPLCSFICDNLR
jgi:hypothetical protein